MLSTLDAIVADLAEADRQDRIEILIDLANNLKPWPARLEACRDARHRVQECQSPVFLVVETDGDHATLFADAPIEAPTVRGFVALLVAGLDGASLKSITAIPDDLIERARLPEILGPLRIRGLHGVLRRLKTEAARSADSKS